jgi:hypothetical protein
VRNDSKKRIYKGFRLDPLTADLIDDIAVKEGINRSELIRLLMRAWRQLDVFEDKFPPLTTWIKAKVISGMVQRELSEIRLITEPKNDV